MKIRLDREWKKNGYTISRVYVNESRFGDGKKWCSALEDEDRGLTASMPLNEIQQRKVYGHTAIPTGRYRVIITYSPRFMKMMPLVCEVKGFSGVRLHAGNTPDDTEGCILFGVNDKVGRVSNSRYWTIKLTKLISSAISQGEEVFLEIE